MENTATITDIDAIIIENLSQGGGVEIITFWLKLQAKNITIAPMPVRFHTRNNLSFSRYFSMEIMREIEDNCSLRVTLKLCKWFGHD